MDLASHMEIGAIQQPEVIPPGASLQRQVTGGSESEHGTERRDLEAISFYSARSHTEPSSADEGTAPSFEKQAAVQPTRPKRPAQNPNRVSHYRWTQELLQRIADGAQDVATDAATQQRWTPLFIIAGACPSRMCRSMQALLLCAREGAVDFWWIKPKTADPTALEWNTVNLHQRGAFKNCPGMSRSVYAPLARLFMGEGLTGASSKEPRFGVDKATGRAYIEEQPMNLLPPRRLLLLMVWQEAWSGSVLRGQTTRGKLLFEVVEASDNTRSPAASPTSPGFLKANSQFRSRQYSIKDGKLSLGPMAEEEEVSSILPPDSFQEMYDD